jgi:hypothetical protein
MPSLAGFCTSAATEVVPVVLLDEPRVQVVDTSELVSQLSRSNLAEQRGWAAVSSAHIVQVVVGAVLSSHGSSFIPAGITRMIAESVRDASSASISPVVG